MKLTRRDLIFYNPITEIHLKRLVIGLLIGLSWNPVFSQLNANFSASPLSGCAPLIVTFTDQSTGNPTGWNWNFGNSATATTQNASTIYSTPGLYSVTLTITNGASNDSEIKINYINVYNKPVAGFNISTDTACVGEIVTYTDNSTISPGGSPIDTWGWDFGDGNATTVSVPSVTHAYTTPGNYPISLIITDTSGCTGTIIKNLVVVPAPTASFTATPNSACLPPLNVSFANTSSSVGTTSYSWNFGDGGISTAVNPTHTYTASGSYTVSLIVNQNGCIDTIKIPNAITIQKITAGFAATPTVVCLGQPVLFNNTSTPSAASSNWNFGDASSSTALNPSHTYTAAGTYTVTLIATDASGCKDTTTSSVTVNQTPAASFTADTTNACSAPFTVNFNSTSTGGTSYTWNFGDGSPASTLQNPTHTYTVAGTYSVSLIVTNPAGPCSDTAIINNFITITPPLASFTHSPDSGCAPLLVNFNSTSTSPLDPIATYSWSFGDGTFGTGSSTSHTYTATGIYSPTLSITTANGCTDTVVCQNCIKVGTLPNANFGILQDTVCYGIQMSFSDSSTGVVTGWYWSFGDGGSSLQQNPNYTYGDTGTFQVYLVAYNNGCSDTSLIQNVVILPPKALISYSLSCTNYYSVQLISQSQGADSLFWDLGDGTKDSSNTDTLTHIYPSRGPITTTLIAYNYLTGCSNTITATYTIAEPIASFSVNPASGCYPFSATFTSTSQDASSYLWNFGDTNTIADTSVAANPNYTYPLPAANQVTLIITDVNGCRDTIVDTVKSLGPLPYFLADTLTGCTPFRVTFTDTSYSDSLLTQWTWNFGDGSPVVTTNNDSVVHVYTQPGVYTVTMSVRDTNGCLKTIVKSNYIRPTYPFPSFSVDTFACKGDVLTFDATATSVVGGVYMWNYGDGQQDTTLNPVITHSYAIDGLYIVTLTVSDTNGCDSTITDTIRILQPTANFGNSILNTGCGTLQVAFQDSSTGFVNQWYWDFGNGANSNLQNPIYTYTQPGIYDVTLIVTNLGGCTDTLILDSIIVVPGPVGNYTFTPTAGCNPLTVCFDASSNNAETYIWDFGDGSVQTAINGDTCHTYSTPGTFNPVLILGNMLPDSTQCLLPATNNTGSVTVTNVINVTLSGPSVINLPEDSLVNIVATYGGGIPPYTYSWSPNTGISCDTCSSVILVGTGDTIVYTFTIYDTAGCIGSDSVLILSTPCFEEKLIPNVFTPNQDGYNDAFYIPGVCPGEEYALQIFDRWGTLMFSTTQRNNGWDGRTSAGMEATEGTYFYVVTLRKLKDAASNPLEDRVIKGYLELLR